jgi:Domain of unknown function (DUF4272)
MLIVKHPFTGNLLVTCDDCEAMWPSPEHALNNTNRIPHNGATKVVDPTYAEVEAAGWDKFLMIPAENGRISAEALCRRLRSETILRAEGVPFLAALPVIDTAAEALKRSKEEVALRTLCLLLVAAKGEGLEQEVVERVLKAYELRPHLTPKELAFALDSSPSQHDRTQFVWRYEAAWTLLWALGFAAQLGKPVQICDVPLAVRTMTGRTTSKFIEDSELRPIADILDQADLIYRYHWAVRDARIKRQPVRDVRIKGQQIAVALDPGVTLERHYALNWLIGYMEQAWDDVTTDT